MQIVKDLLKTPQMLLSPSYPVEQLAECSLPVEKLFRDLDSCIEIDAVYSPRKDVIRHTAGQHPLVTDTI